MKRKISEWEFSNALANIKKPGGQQLRFLEAHYRAQGRATTVSVLAREVGYQGYSGINLHYGTLAKKIGSYVGEPNCDIELLVDVVRPPTLTNDQWILVMKPEFADALVRAGWVEPHASAKTAA